VFANVPYKMTLRIGIALPLAATLAACLLAAGAASAQTARTPAAPPSGPDPTGEWLVAKQVARIRIVDCEGRMWGVVAWEATPGVDRKNPEPNLRTRPTLGMPILLGMAPSQYDKNKWEGEIYNSEDGHTYSANISLPDPSTLKVQGCFLGFLCGGENWSRADTAETPTGTSGQKSAVKPPATRKTTGTRPGSADKTATESNEEVCLRVAGPPGLTHERGLK
jgi:uncharacterized protein (DUF2147 family)